MKNMEVWSLIHPSFFATSIHIEATSTQLSQTYNLWKSHTNLTHPGKYFRPSKVKIMRPTSPK